MFPHNPFSTRLAGVRIGAIDGFLRCTKKIFRCPYLIKGVEKPVARIQLLSQCIVRVALDAGFVVTLFGEIELH